MVGAVVGLACSCSTTVAGTPRAEQAQASSATGVAAPPTPATTAAPEVRVVGEQELEGLLLPVEDIRTIMDAPDAQVDQSYAEMPPSTVGYVPEDCARAAFNTVESGYRDSGFAAVRGAVIQEPQDTTLLHVVDQGVVTFPDAAAATTYVTRTLEAWKRCAGTQFTALRPEAAEHWTFGDVNESDGIGSIPKMAEGSDWTCSHAISTRANVVIDVSACGFSIADQASQIVAKIREKLPA